MVKKAVKQIVKKKRWVTIVSPSFLGDKQLGESYLTEPETSVGRTVSMNLMQVTGDIKAQSSSVVFEISDYKDNKLITKLVSYEYLQAAVKRLVRRRMSKIDDSIVALTKDNVKFRVKPLILTKGKVARSVDYKLRATVRLEIIKYVNSVPSEELFSGVLKGRIQNEIKGKINVIYPIKTVIIRVLKLDHTNSKPTPVPVIRESKKSALDNEEKKEKKSNRKGKTQEDVIEKDVLAEKELE